MKGKIGDLALGMLQGIGNAASAARKIEAFVQEPQVCGVKHETLLNLAAGCESLFTACAKTLDQG
jgi:hypothetical protein